MLHRNAFCQDFQPFFLQGAQFLIVKDQIGSPSGSICQTSRGKWSLLARAAHEIALFLKSSSWTTFCKPLNSHICPAVQTVQVPSLSARIVSYLDRYANHLQVYLGAIFTGFRSQPFRSPCFTLERWPISFWNSSKFHLPGPCFQEITRLSEMIKCFKYI